MSELWWHVHPPGEDGPAADAIDGERHEDQEEDGNLRALDTLQYEAARQAARDPSPPAPDEIEDLAALAAFARELVKTPSGPAGRRHPRRRR